MIQEEYRDRIQPCRRGVWETTVLGVDITEWYRDHHSTTSQLMTCMKIQNPPSATLQKTGWWTRRLCCSSQEPCQGGEMGRQESHQLQPREMESPVPELLMDTKLSVIQQGSRSAVSQGPLGRVLPADWQRWSFPSPQPWWDKPGVLAQCWAPLYKRQGDSGVIIVNSYWVMKGFEHMAHEEHRRLRGDFISVHKYLMEEVQKIHWNTETQKSHLHIRKH